MNQTRQRPYGMRRIVLVSMSLATTALSAQHARVTDSRPAADEHIQDVLVRPVTVSFDRIDATAAVLAIGRSARVRILFANDLLESIGTPVTLHVTNVPLRLALDNILRGTALHAVALKPDVVEIIQASDGARTASGTLIGTVIDSKTRRPVHEANIAIDGATKGVLTAEDGTYRLLGVAAGTHMITVKHLGYVRQTRQFTVADGVATTLDVLLEPSASVLDQVVVTGTVAQTELKAVPNAITVITAKQIEERGITKIDQLFRGDVPGVFAQNQGANAPLDEVTMFSRGATALHEIDPQTGVFVAFSNPIKTYVDGIELADPKYLSQIDPKSIERIEILTGPQASTIYGSNAINGVMQIFTKRGTTSKPQLTLNLLSGWVENNFSSARTPQHDYSAQLNGIEGRLSYNIGGAWNYMGPWTPAKQLARTGGFGGARLELPTPVGLVTTDMTLRRTVTQSVQRGDGSQTYTAYRETGWYTNISASGLSQPTTYVLNGQTLGVTFSYVPVSWWSHEFGMGQDASDTEMRRTARGYMSRGDTTLLLIQSHTDRRSLRYTTTAHIPVTSFAQTTVTVGVDAWQNLASSLAVTPQTLTGQLTNVSDVSRQPEHNTGGFLQTQLGVGDRLFLTYGLRAEWNPNYGAEAQPNYAPRYGIAYTKDVGAVTAKLRGSYGRSTRPPQSDLKAALTIADAYGSSWSSNAAFILPYYGGIFDWYLANAELAPEHQQGGEGGIELYWGTRGSVVITRYNQTVDGLISNPTVDSVRTLVPCPPATCNAENVDADGYGYWRQHQFLNVGSIRNQGWELQGKVNTGPFTTHGTYSWTKSRTIGVNAKYRTYFASQPQYQPGATFQYLPEHTWALGVTYAHAQTLMGLNVTGVGRATIASDNSYAHNFSSSIRLPQNRLRMNIPSGYIYFNTGYALADLTASHRFTTRVEGVLQVQNLTDHYRNDYSTGDATMGRQTKMGARIQM